MEEGDTPILPSMRRRFLLAALLLPVLATLITGGLWRGRLRAQALKGDAAFAAGGLPYPIPRGAYREPTEKGGTSWDGKTFRSDGKAGKDMRRSGGEDRDGPAFAMRRQSGSLLLDYDVEGNWPWQRRRIAELVELSPDKFLVKRWYRVGDARWYAGYQWLER